MVQNTITLQELKAGHQFNTYYGDGELKGVLTITRFTKCYVWYVLETISGTTGQPYKWNEAKLHDTQVAKKIASGEWLCLNQFAI